MNITIIFRFDKKRRRRADRGGDRCAAGKTEIPADRNDALLYYFSISIASAEARGAAAHTTRIRAAHEGPLIRTLITHGVPPSLAAFAQRHFLAGYTAQVRASLIGEATPRPSAAYMRFTTIYDAL